MNELNCVKPPTGWNPDLPNPFSPDGSYGMSWSALTIVPDSGERLGYPGNCRSRSGCFRCTVGMENDSLLMSTGDFLRYESAHGRTVIVSCPDDLDIDELVRKAIRQTPAPTVVRAADPRWLVHSTPRERWPIIRACGELRSSACLHREGVDWKEVGFSQLGEPDEYREYVVLGDVGHVGCEHVVASHQRGVVFTDENAPYRPGVRLYFDAHRIIRDGLAVRDGLHPLKVRDRLPLDPYRAAAIGIRDVDPEQKTRDWTPRTLLDAANVRFADIAGGPLGGTGVP